MPRSYTFYSQKTERGRERDTHTHTQRGREKERDTHTQRERESDRHRERESERVRGIERKSQRLGERGLSWLKESLFFLFFFLSFFSISPSPC